MGDPKIFEIDLLKLNSLKGTAAGLWIIIFFNGLLSSLEMAIHKVLSKYFVVHDSLKTFKIPGM